ncbi:MAG: DUF1013 domain-containing protein [Alphaproteobacteria bacterium]|nr:MAG: DUF1013 domain-containing protein [Alphaproteobacteria bacterium]
MPAPLMPKATAVWLVENTKLTFEQIAEFCGLHELEVQAIADGDVAFGMPGLNPVLNSHVTAENIAEAEADPKVKLKMIKDDLPVPVKRSKGPRYTPVSKRQDKPDGIAWLVKAHPELLDAQIARLMGTTKPTIKQIRDRSHWNIANIKPRHPVGLGLCSQPDLDAAVAKAGRRIKNAEKAAARAAKLAAQQTEQATAAASVVLQQPASVEQETAPSPESLPEAVNN